MERSGDRILTTHTGSLPRSTALTAMLYDKEHARLSDRGVFERTVREETRRLVRQQAECGLDAINDGEAGKISYATYVKDRLTGFGGEAPFVGLTDVAEFPVFAQRYASGAKGLSELHMPKCVGPIAWHDKEAFARDIANFKTALAGVPHRDAFMTAASPGVVAMFLRNEYYPSYEKYLEALAHTMKEEYDAIHRAGFVLQLDCPDLGVGAHTVYAPTDRKEFRKMIARNVEALNRAVADIPRDRIRLHLCWGNYEGPHHHDIPLSDIIDIVSKAKAGGISFEAANPRHGHEWTVFQDVKLPDDTILIPGVVESSTNYIEHPEYVAQRICRYAEIVGRENVIAGTDCGFATFAGHTPIDPAIAWAKLGALVEGARLASDRLWS